MPSLIANRKTERKHFKIEAFFGTPTLFSVCCTFGVHFTEKQIFVSSHMYYLY